MAQESAGTSMLAALGAEDGCLRLATEFYSRVAADPVLRPLFPGKSFRCATEEFSAFLVQFLGGNEENTQYRWWLSLRESHARFRITEAHRTAWLKQMEATLRASNLTQKTQKALLQFFESSSAYLLGRASDDVREPDLARRWNRAQALDKFVQDIVDRRDPEVLRGYREFADSPSVFVGVLSRMMKTGRPALVRAVVDAIKADPSLGSLHHAGKTLLHNAAAAGCPVVVALLLDANVDANVLDRGDHPPLYSVANGCGSDAGPEIVRMLVNAGADVNYCGGTTRSTPLHMAARWGQVAIAKTLLELGASPEAKDSKGCTPLDRALNCRRPEVASLLRRIPIS